MDGFPPPTLGEGAWGWGDNRAREERLTPFGDRSLLRFIPPRTGVVIHVSPLRGCFKMRNLLTARLTSVGRVASVFLLYFFLR